MKRLLVIILALALALSLCACVGQEDTDPENDPSDLIEDDQEPNLEMRVITFKFPQRTDDYEKRYGERPAWVENIRLEALYEDGVLIGFDNETSNLSVLGIVSENEIVVESGFADQIYRIDLETFEATPLISEEAFGHTYDEYYESVTKKWTWLEWCENPVLNGNWNQTDRMMIAYYSNKYCSDDGVITNEENCWEYAALWILDIETGEEIRIPVPENTELIGSSIGWLNDKTVQFNVSVDDETDVCYIYDTVSGEVSIIE